MNILHIITGLNDGGAEAVLYRLCSSDKTLQYHVVSLMDTGKYGPLLEQAGVPVVCLGMSQGRLSVSGLWRLWRLLRRQTPDVVQTWMYHADLIGGVVARLAGVRRVFWGIHNTTLERGKSHRTTIAIARLNAWLSRWVPTAIVCCAERAREVHQALGYAADKLMVIPNGYDLDRFRPDPAARARLRAEWGMDHETPLLGMVGRFDPQKDHENLLHALGRLKQAGTPFRCVLVGRGLDATNAQLAAWFEQYGLQDKVLVLGQRSDVPAVMCALDLHVLSSAYGEAFPNVLAEAMACGTPCVTTDVGDAAAIVSDTGWVVPPANSARLAEAIEAALAARDDTSVWQARREAARTRVAERFSLEKMVAAYHAVWGGLKDNDSCAP
jgi:glycosyltransferase involved in cell wall biosynthesis